MLWDVFISHASEDKESVARPLAAALEAAGLRVWIDEAQLKLGDSLRAKLDDGLSQSRYGVVILSSSFFAKRWPQRELGALFSRRDAILPVWHGLSSSEINAISPLLADIIAVTTSEGIDSVALKVLDVAGKHLPSRRIGRAQYTSELSVPLERIGRALEVIDSLGNEATWSQLQIDAPGYPSSGWMGSNSSTLIEIVYGFAAPLVAYRRLSYSVRRNLALLDAQTRLHFALLESAFDLFTNEAALATVAPPIDYSPRVPGWREKKDGRPARYWWQGISPERFDAALLRGKALTTPILLCRWRSSPKSIGVLLSLEMRRSSKPLGCSRTGSMDLLRLLAPSYGVCASVWLGSITLCWVTANLI